MVIEKGAEDEILILQSFAIQINIAGLIDYINRNSGVFQIKKCDTDVLLSINRTDGINTQFLKQINEVRLDQPVLVTAIDEYEWVIDGNHRLLRRHELGKLTTNYIPINGERLDPFVSEFSWR